MEEEYGVRGGSIREEDGVRARSFRFEDYNNRRAFLRSYPLHCDVDEKKKEDVPKIANSRKIPRKEKCLSMFQFGGGKFLLLRKLKNKVATFYLAACYPLGLNPTKCLLSV